VIPFHARKTATQHLKREPDMDQADYRTIKIERRGRILYLILKRPGALNAVDARMHTELARVFRDAGEDADSDVVVLTGAGRMDHPPQHFGSA
jgi:1,4-dihydroxy-2-naphthoyl-CoA synthase